MMEEIVPLVVGVVAFVAFVVAAYRYNEYAHREIRKEIVANDETRRLSDRPMKINWKY